MGLIQEINNSLREKDPVEIALESCSKTATENEESSVCSEYMDPSRVNDFATAISDLMKKEKISYGEAKAKAFDETEEPPNGSPCCKLIKSKVQQINSK